MADRAVLYIREQNALAPDKPFFVYYAPGTAHAPHHAPKEWITKFKGQFDQGWDKVREETFARQKQMGIIPKDTVLTPRPDSIKAWDSLNSQQKELYARMMEVYAGALSHMDHQVDRILDAIEETGEMDNTLVIYLMGDNGASAEGSPDGLLNEMTFFNNIPVPFEDTYARIDDLGRSQHLRTLSDWLGTRDGHAFSVDQADRLAFWRHAQRAGHRMAESDQRQRWYSVSVPPRGRHRAHHPGSDWAAGA